MDKSEIAEEWFFFAEKDISSAKFLKGMRPIPLEVICYHCQQGAEKYLKGFLAFNNEKITKIHDLLILNKKCCQYESSFYDIEEECLRLTDYGVNIRYPSHFEITGKDMELAIKDARKIQSFVMKLMPGKSLK